MTETIQIGDIVWAKMPSYPLWPAIVIYPVPQVTAPYIGDESQHFVKFYGPGTNLCCWIPDKHIVLHSQNLIKEGKNKKSKKLQSAIVELEKHLKSEGLIVETQDEETYKKKKYKKRKRDQTAIKAKNKKTNVSGNKKINDTDVVIEDHNLYNNLEEIDKYYQMQEEETAFDGLEMQEKEHAFDGLQMQNEHELDKSYEIQDKVDKHPKVLPNKDCVMEDNMAIKNQCVQQLEMDQVIPIKDCATEKDSTSPEQRDWEAIKAKNKKTKVSGSKEINDTDVVIEDHNLYNNLKEIDEYHQMQEEEPALDGLQMQEKEHAFDGLQMQEKEHAFDGLQMQNEHELDKSKIDEHPKVLPNKDCVTEGYMKTIRQQLETEQTIPIKVGNRRGGAVTEKDSTSPEQSIDTTLKLLFSDEILLNEFWKNKSGKKQALKHLQKIIEVLKDEIQKEESLKIEKCDMQFQEKEANEAPNLHQTDKFDEAQKMLKQHGKVLEHSKILKNKEKKDNEGKNKVLCNPDMRANKQQVLSTKDYIAGRKSSPSEQSTNKTIEPIIYSTEALVGEFFETAIPNAQFTTSSENEFHENVRPNDSDTLHLKCSQKGLNIMPHVLPPFKPFGVPNDSNKNKASLFKKYLLSSAGHLKFGFMGNGFLKCSILRKLILSKFNVTLWLDKSIEANEEAYYTSGAKTVHTFQALMENCDIIFSYWENSKTVKFQVSQVLCSVSQEVFARKGYVELSTLDSETAYTCGKAVTSYGGRFLEAAVLGDKQDAENGDLVILASGDQNLFDECSSPFRAISKSSHYFRGEIGRGSRMKIGHSMVQGIALAGLAEVVALIRRTGFNEDEFTDVLNFTPFQHRFWMGKAKLMFRDSHISFRPVEDQRKDFYFGLKLALRLKQPTWTCSAANFFFERNNLDTSAIPSMHLKASK